MSKKSKKLKTETNTPDMEERILKAFQVSNHYDPEDTATTVFEHGQWWITLDWSGDLYSVIDASGTGSIDGFDFRKIS